MTSQTPTPERETLLADLDHLIAGYENAAGRIRHGAPYQAANRDVHAAQLRLIRHLTADGGDLDLAIAWIEAARELLHTFDRLDSTPVPTLPTPRRWSL